MSAQLDRRQKRMIPKTIHYCWFGGAKKSNLAERCIASWRRVMPDWDIREWSEDSFDIGQNWYAKEAYEQRKWAFVSDYARLKILYEHGGVYMDTDVEALKPLDAFLVHGAFSGFEDDKYISPVIIGAQRGNGWIRDLLDDYDNRLFVLPGGELDITTNVITVTEKSKALHGFVPNGEYQVLVHDVHIYPTEWFCPLSCEYGIMRMTEDSHTIHYWNASWLPPRRRLIAKTRRWIRKNLGETVWSVVRKTAESVGIGPTGRTMPRR